MHFYNKSRYNLTVLLYQYIATAIVSLYTFQVTEKVLVAYRNLLSSDPRVQIFNNHTMHTESSLQASFQILPAAEVWDGVTSLVFSNFHFSSGEHNHRYNTELHRSMHHALGVSKHMVYSA